MGYFRIFYYVAYIFNTLTRIIKRHGKWLLWFISIAIFLVVCMYNPKSQAVYIGNQVTSSYETIYDKYDSICIDFIRRFDKYRNQVGVADTVNTIVNNFKTEDYYIYYNSSDTDDFGLSSVDGGLFQTAFIRCWFYQTSNFSLNLSYSNYEKYYGIEDQIRTVTTDRVRSNRVVLVNYDGTGVYIYNQGANNSYYIPQSLFHYQNRYIYEYFVNNASLKEIELLYEMRNKLSSVDDTLQQQQEFLEQEPSSEDFSTSDLPTDSGVTDTTTTGVDNIFTTVYNVFTGNVETSKRNINITIPFTR